MASGEFEFGIAGGKLQGKIVWSSVKGTATQNYSTVSATLYARRVDGYQTQGQTWSGYVKIGTEQANINFSSSVIVGSNWVTMATKSGVVVSHNANGTGSVTISGSVTGPSGTSLAGVTSSGSSTVTLDTIARYFSSTPTITLTSKTETSFNLTWNTSETCSRVVLYVGGQIYSTNNVNAKTGPLTITGKSANTSYAVYAKFTRSDSGLTNDSATATWTTYQYPYVSGVSVANLKIGNQQTLTLYNPLGRSVAIYMKKDSTSGTTLFSQTSATTGTSYPFTPAANTLYGSISSSTSGNAVYYCTYSNHTISSKSGTYSINGTEVPTFSNFTFEDTNSTTTALTGDNSILVKGYSNVLISVPVANKAIANNSAIMRSYKMQVEGMNAITKDYSSSEIVSATQNGATSNNISVTAIDSRGLTTTVTKSGTLKDYFKPYVKTLTATRDNNGVGTTVTLAYEIDFWNQSFGSVSNSVMALTYQHRTASGNWTTGETTLTYSLSGNKLTGSASIKGDIGAEGFTLGETFDILLTIQDKLSTITGTATLLSGTPAIAIAGKQVAIGGPVNTNNSRALQVKGDMDVNGVIYGDTLRAVEVNNIRTKNRLNPHSFVKGRLENGVLAKEYGTTSLTTTDNSISFTTNVAWNSGATSDFIPVSEGSYTYTAKSDKKVYYYIDTYTSSKTWIARLVNGNQTGEGTNTFSVGNAVAYIRLHYEVDSASTYTITNPQIERGSTATNFMPHQNLDENGSVTYTKVTGTYTTGAWSAGTVNCTWTAPRTGKYIMWMYFQPQTESTAYIYKQLQAKGTATRPMGDILFYQGGPTSGGAFNGTVIAINCCFPVEATAGQTIYPYVHTPTANLVWNVAITGMYVGR